MPIRTVISGLRRTYINVPGEKLQQSPTSAVFGSAERPRTGHKAVTCSRRMVSNSYRVWAALLLAIMATTGLVTVNAEWTTGRMTFYDDNTEGACRYGTGIPTYYGAWPDGQKGAPACGVCYEVMCVNRNFRDGYGKTLSRTDDCFDESESIIIKIVDSCPCVHENYYSNQRWCCNDSPHLDLGRAAFKKLARESDGVVGAKWRQVACPDGMDNTSAYPSGYKGSSSSSDDDDGPARTVRRRRSRSSSSSRRSSRWSFGRK